MANHILLLCAAATAGLRQGRFPAHDAHDARDALDGRGRAAARAARTRLLDLAGANGAVFSSPAMAARQTAAALGRASRVDAALRDADYGQWRGRLLRDVACEAPERLRAWLHDSAAAPPAGESFAQVVARFDAWLETRLRDPASAIADAGRRGSGEPPADAAMDTRAGAPVIAITHAVVMRAAALRCAGMPLDAAARWDVAPLSVMTLERRGDAWVCPVLPARPAHPADPAQSR